MLHTLITLKYGTPSEWAQEALAQADTQQLDAWGEGILTASTLEALLGKNTSDNAAMPKLKHCGILMR